MCGRVVGPARCCNLQSHVPMTQKSSRKAEAPPPSSKAGALVTSGAIAHQLSRLYALTEESPHLFGSALGPITLAGVDYHIARFVYFGAKAGDDSVRLTFHTGYDGADARSIGALAHFVARLALKPDLGHGLNLSFFPVVNPTGVEFGSRRNANGADLAAESWEESIEPEIAVLRQDAYVRGYHGFVRVEAGAVEAVTATVRQPGHTQMSGLPALIAEESSDVFPIRWERDTTRPASGPLTIADDFALQPFELVLRFPQQWSDDVYRDAVNQVLRRFIVRYRATLSYGLNL
jgi:hypothetical protein